MNKPSSRQSDDLWANFVDTVHEYRDGLMDWDRLILIRLDGEYVISIQNALE